MKAELLVTAGQHTAVNTFPGLVHTARHTMGVGSTLRRCANPQGTRPVTRGQTSFRYLAVKDAEATGTGNKQQDST